MKVCKHCSKPLILTLTGLRNFCSFECQKAYRKAKQAAWLRKKRNVDITGGYSDMDSQVVDSTNPHGKPISRGQNQGLGLSEDNFSGFGGRTWYEKAKKRCCNFEVREREGYCVTILQPLQTFRKPCSECSLMHDLLFHESQKLAKRKKAA